MTDSPHIVPLDEQNFVQVVVEGSVQRPVLIDFWADWCEPCKTLMPLLERLAVEYDGAFTLAKLDTERYPAVAQQFGIRSLPTVMLFAGGQLVDQFAGALPETELRRFLETHVGPSPGADEGSEAAGGGVVAEAMALFERGDAETARARLTEAQAADPENAEILLALGQVALATGELETAESCLGALPEAVRDGVQGRRLAATVELAREGAPEESVAELEAALAANPGDSAARYRLATAAALAGDVQGGMDHLLTLVQRAPDLNDGAPKAKLLALFDVLGDDPLATRYRRKLFGLLN